ncbi:MAG: class I SAM-dependent methyltransferase [Acidimicrobiia bacterium]|nr:class I SAM-dependent methyltransferase [Acidimicrobiia bacterium]
MPGLDENADVWARQWDWSDEGEQWSAWWGGTDAMWFGAVLPRIHAFVPAARVLEIGPGYGRWTSRLRPLSGHLVLVDMTARCIEHCRERFGDSAGIEYHVNDGRSLAMVDDESIDFVFSMDSLVHVESDVLHRYLDQLARKLTPDGIAFLHHSNLGAYRTLTALARRVPPRLLRPLVRRGLAVDLFAWRAESVTAQGVANQCARAGLACVSQETISWEFGRFQIDALSVVTRPGSRWHRPTRLAANPGFGAEARRVAALYAAAGSTNPGRAG